ncbi:sugar phosphate isomerase/epimerase family protein [Congzhengia minquanensis]|uniref:Sugar phosphate isomerase/epimerase n=1 Tax=Congzhengia minquanensis TaxID=2763657 RepID=A0A926DPG3_9FIRM|nr:TIM barrel protein [Congzhengia minquanensis]MBC8541601.1 sugar phosphate isomerase/epimerase [Congzhengia minquanensis]
MEKLGLQLFTIRDFLKTPEDVKNSFSKLIELGYTEGQTATSDWYGMGAEKFRDICRETGLSICGTHYSFDRIYDATDEVMKEHEIVGTTNIGIGGMPGLSEMTLESVKVFVEKFNEVARKIHKHGFKLTYHNHHWEFAKHSGVRIMDYLADNLDKDATSFVLDTHWVQAGGGDVIDWMKKLAGRIDILHLKDYKIENGERAFAEIYEGNINFDGVLKTAEEIGVKHYVVEEDTCPGDPFDSIRISADNLKARGYLK